MHYYVGLPTSLLVFHALFGRVNAPKSGRFPNAHLKAFEGSHESRKKLAFDVITEETIKPSEWFVFRIYDVRRTDSGDLGLHLLVSKPGSEETRTRDRENLMRFVTILCTYTFEWDKEETITAHTWAPYALWNETYGRQQKFAEVGIYDK